MLIRQLEYLVALASEQHFARAAERCGVSQPTLSAGLRQLEDDLGVAIVERGTRFRGFTADGEIALRWARRMLADEMGLRQELDASHGALKGRLRLGVIPSTNAVVPYLSATFAARHPGVSIDETETTSIEVLRKLAAYELDAAITYVNNEPLDHVRTLPIYDEQYVALIPAASPLAASDQITWQQLATVPLCLMNRDMQNRRIYDAAFASAGCTPDVRVEVHSMMAELAYLQAGDLGTIMPSSLRPWLEVAGMRVVSIVQPTVSKAVGLVITDRSPLPALVEGFWRHVEQVVPTLTHLPPAGQSTTSIAS